MSLTAQQLYEACQIIPSYLGPTIVNPDDSDADQVTAATQYIEDNVLPGAIAEVQIGFRAVAGKGSIADFLSCRFADMDSDEATELQTEGDNLFDSAAKSYGRSEINKVIASDRKEFDEDAAQDRKDGDAKLKKLQAWAQMVIDNTSVNPLDCGDDGMSGDPTSKFKGRMESYCAKVNPVW